MTDFAEIQLVFVGSDMPTVMELISSRTRQFNGRNQRSLLVLFRNTLYSFSHNCTLALLILKFISSDPFHCHA